MICDEWLISSCFIKAMEKCFRVLGRAAMSSILGWVSQLHDEKVSQSFSRVLLYHGSWEIHFSESFIEIDVLFLSLLGTAPICSRSCQCNKSKQKTKKPKKSIFSLIVVKHLPYFLCIFLSSASLLPLFLYVASTAWTNRVRHWAESCL